MHAAPLAERTRRPWVVWTWLAVVFVVLRIPSLLEPNWYADEGTYADIGRALTHGAALYRDVWDNKPPGMYWLAAAVIATAGAAAPAFHMLLAAIIGAGVVAVWRIAHPLGGVSAAATAGLLFVVLMSLPNLDGDLLNAEVVGGVLVLWAMSLLLTDQQSGGLRYAVAGLLIGAATATKPVFALDLLAAAAVPLWTARATAAPLRKTLARAVGWLAAGMGSAVAIVITISAARGSLSGLADVLIHQDVDYVQLTNGPGGSVVYHAGRAVRLMSTALLALRVGVPLAIAGTAAWRVSRAGRASMAALVWWLGCDVGGAMVSARGLTHYAQQAEGALAITAALLAAGLWRRGGSRRCAAILLMLMAWPAVELTLLVPRAEVAAANGDPFPPLEHHNFRAGQLGDYYSASIRRLLGRESDQEYDAVFPYNAARARSVEALFARHSRPGDRVFIWGTVHWAYALADRVPAGRYVSLNDAYYVDPESQSRLVGELRENPPLVLVADAPLPAVIRDQLARGHYRRLPGAADGDDAWLAESAP